MTRNIKNIVYAGLVGITAFAMTSCNDALDQTPVSQITPEGYYNNASQVEAYLNNYYSSFITSPFSSMYHGSSYNDGMIRSDANTDIFVSGLAGNTTLFAKDHWNTPSGKSLQDYYYNVRVMNYVINMVQQRIKEGVLSESDPDLKNALGEAYFMRALVYFNILGTFGDCPWVTEVLDNTDDAIIPASERTPRTELADNILSDMDNAISRLYDRSAYNGQRLNKQAAQVFASRVALFEATFEKYHKGSGRVPGDSNWPGAKMSYNSGKTFDIDGHVKTLLNKVLTYAQPVADSNHLTESTHLLEPTTEGSSCYEWNPYFEMFSQNTLKECQEVLLWREYNVTQSMTHDVPYRTLMGCADGYTRNFVQSFLCKDGKPIYATDEYKGDDTYKHVMENRDERLQLFVWSDQRMDPQKKDSVFVVPDMVSGNTQIRCITGYQPRKYFAYDAAQTADDALHGYNACPIFRTTEAMLNYMEASAELNGGKPDDKAIGYWKQLRKRAGVSDDIDATVNATVLEKEYDGGNGDFGVYSGTTMVDPWIYNVRRERLDEMFGEGVRRMDLVRWRSYDNLVTNKWIPEGVNFWTSIYEDLIKYRKADTASWDDGTNNATVSSKELSKYFRPYSINMSSTNECANGYTWTEAYYLSPLGVEDLTSASPNRDVESSMLYQNINWSTQAGDHALK